MCEKKNSNSCCFDLQWAYHTGTILLKAKNKKKRKEKIDDSKWNALIFKNKCTYLNYLKHWATNINSQKLWADILLPFSTASCSFMHSLRNFIQTFPHLSYLQGRRPTLQRHSYRLIHFLTAPPFSTKIQTNHPIKTILYCIHTAISSEI